MYVCVSVCSYMHMSAGVTGVRGAGVTGGWEVLAKDAGN